MKLEMSKCVGVIKKLPEQVIKKNGQPMNAWTFWVEQYDDKYPQTIEFKLFQKGMDEFDAKIGDKVEIDYVLGGREYSGRVFLEAKCFGVHVVSESTQTTVAEKLQVDDDDISDLPF